MADEATTKTSRVTLFSGARKDFHQHTMAETSTTKTTRLPSFSGARRDFGSWWVRFIAYASVWKFHAALLKGGESTLPKNDDEVVVETTTVGKERLQRNEEMY
jgi:hypothetical protein